MSFPYELLPAFNALMNLTSACLLALGYFFIRRKKIHWHLTAMLGAFGTSTVFLVSYLVYHVHGGIKHYQGVGLRRSLYFLILITHTILATVILPLILRTLYL